MSFIECRRFRLFIRNLHHSGDVVARSIEPVSVGAKASVIFHIAENFIDYILSYPLIFQVNDSACANALF